MYKKSIFSILMIVLLILSGCSSKESKGEKSSFDLMEAMEDNQEDEEKTGKDVSYGQFGFGVVTKEEGTISYTYENEDISIPYYVEGLDPAMDSNFGIIVFVDGIAQPYCIRKKDGSISEEAYMTKFSLKEKEKETFDIVFKPVSGKKGEKIGVMIATILAPDYLPENEKNTSFGVYHSLSANIPQQIIMNKEGINNRKNNDKNITYGDIPKEILEDAENTYGEDIYNILDYSCVLNIVPQEGNIIREENGKINFKIQCYGGLEVTNRITVFLNNHPVKINENGDYSEVYVEKNKMVEIDCCIDVSQIKEFQKINSLYAVAMTAGQDYEIQDIFKSDSVLVLEQEGSSTETEKLYAEIDYKSNKINLLNLHEDKKIYTLQMEKETYAESVHEMSDGYGIIVAHSKKGVNIKKVNKVSFVEFPYDISGRDFVITNSKLEIQHTIRLDEYFSNSLSENLIKILISSDGKTIAFHTAEGLYLLDVDSRKCNKIFPPENSNSVCFFTDIIFVDNDTLAFTGVTEKLLDKVVDDKSTGIGLINKEGDLLFEDVISDYPVSMITSNAGYVCFLDSIDPETGSTRGGGKVKILNSKTHELKTISGSGNESALGRVSLDGTYLILAMQSEKGSYQISSYNLQNGVLENRLIGTMKNIKLIEIQAQEGSKAEIVYRTDDGVGGIAFDAEKH